MEPTWPDLLHICAQDSSFRGLVPLGVGAIGGTATAAFNVNDSALFKAVVQVRICRQWYLVWLILHPDDIGFDQMTFASQASNMPAPRTAIPPAHHARSAPVGPASYSTQLAPPRPPGPAYQVTYPCVSL